MEQIKKVFLWLTILFVTTISPLLYSNNITLNNELTFCFTLITTSLFFLSKSIEHNRHISLSIGDILCLFLVIYISSHNRTSWSILTNIAILTTYFLFRTENRAKYILLKCLVFSGAIQIGIIIMQMLGHYSSEGSIIITGSFYNSAVLAMHILICCTAGIILLIESNNIFYRIAFFIFISLALIALFITKSRICIIATTIIAIYYLTKYFHYNGKIFWSITIFIALLITTILYFIRPESANGRLLIWRVSFDMFKNAFLFGYGENAYNCDYMLYQANFFSNHPHSTLAYLADNVSYPFNEYIGIAVKYGLIGLAFSYAFITQFVKIAIKQHNNLLVLIITYLIIAITSYPFEISHLYLVFFAILGSQHQNKLITFRIKKECKIAITFCFLTITTIGFYNLFDLYHANKNLCNLYKMQIEISDKYYEKYKLNNHFNDYYFTWYMNNKQNCIDKRILDAFPSSESYCYMAQYLYQNNQIADAIHHLEISINMIPTRIKPRYELWKIYKEIGDSIKAKKVATDVMQMPIKIESTTFLKLRKKMQQ